MTSKAGILLDAVLEISLMFGVILASLLEQVLNVQVHVPAAHVLRRQTAHLATIQTAQQVLIFGQAPILA